MNKELEDFYKFANQEIFKENSLEFLQGEWRKVQLKEYWAKYEILYDAMCRITNPPIQSEMDEIIRIVHTYYPDQPALDKSFKAGMNHAMLLNFK